jgi:integrase/recombinase XerD
MEESMKGFNEFIREKTYLSNVSPATVYWYKQSFKSLGNPDPTEADITEWVVRLREDGLSPESINTYARAINCYLRWKGSSVKVPKLKVQEKIPETFGKPDIEKFAKWKPKSDAQKRLQCLVLMLADCGLRIEEALNLKWVDISFDDLLVLVHGKGGKSRRVPFSFELRKYLFKRPTQYELMFCTRDGRKLRQRNMLRDVKLLCKKLAIRVPSRSIHALRHSFAVNYLRRGGSVFHLQKCLGHSTLDMTRKYANLMTEDLSAHSATPSFTCAQSMRSVPLSLKTRP